MSASIRPESLDPLDPETVECPFPFYGALREHAPVHRVPGRDWFLVSTFEMAVEVLKDTEAFSSASGVGVPAGPGGQHPQPPSARVHTLLTADPPVHSRYRTLVNRAFSVRRVAAMEGEVRRLADELISEFAPQGVVELGEAFAVPLPLVVICDMLGLPRSDLRQFKTWSDGIAQLGGLVDDEQLRVIQLGNVEFARYLAARVEERRREPRDDIMTDLITLTFEAPDGEHRALRDDEILSILPQLLVAGNETTTNTITSGVALLLEHADQMDAVRADRSAIPNLVEEVLRLESPVQCHFRRATRDTVLGGVEIPAGSGVGVLYAAANRDEQQFVDADRFDVRRDNARTHLAFSQGIHFCVGAPLARLEAKVAFEALLDRLDGIRFAPGRNDFRHVPSFTHRGLKELWIEFDAR
jgi:cytochrome P450